MTINLKIKPNRNKEVQSSKMKTLCSTLQVGFVQENNYLKTRRELYEICEDEGIKISKLGKLSNGEDRPIININKGEGDSFIIISGEDEDESTPVSAMPRLIKELNCGLKSNVTILPFFDVSPPIHKIIGSKDETVNYKLIKRNLSYYKLYSASELKQKVEDRLTKELVTNITPNEIVDGIHEVLVTPTLLAIDADTVDKGTIDSVVYGLHDVLPCSFYVPYFKEGVVKWIYNKELQYQGKTQAHFRSFHTAFDMEKEVPQIKQLKDFIGRYDHALTLHSDSEDSFGLISYKTPKNVTDGIIKNIESRGVKIYDVSSWCESFPKSEQRHGVVEIYGEFPSVSVGSAKKSYLVAEVPNNSALGVTCTENVVKDYLNGFI